MSAAALAAKILALAPLLSNYTTGSPVPRNPLVVGAIAIVAERTSRPAYWAAVLDVYGIHETGQAGELAAGGCPGVPRGVLCLRAQGARYCSAWMVLCVLVPSGSSLVDQAAIAIDAFKASAAACPSHPFGRFVGVGCHPSTIADRRSAEISRELARLR